MIEVREGVAGAFAAVWAINGEGQPGASPFARDELTQLLDAPGHVLVAVAREAEAERVAGYCVIYQSSEGYSGEEFAWFKGRYPAFLYVDQVAVAARLRRSGSGSALYSAVERSARVRELPMVACEVNVVPPNPVSLTFHERNGFDEVGALDTSDGRSVALLVKVVRG